MSKPNFFDIVPSAERQLKADVIAWVTCGNDHELAICKRKVKTPWPWLVVTYRNSYDNFVERRSFATFAEAWLHYTAKVELFCAEHHAAPRDNGKGKKGQKPK